MRIEVEQKHRIEDAAALVARLDERGVSLGPPVVQSDHYFAHPCRDFAKTDEALRIRTTGNRSYVTYKGPKLDATTKSRRELELPLATGEAEFTALLDALGFTPVLVVQKTRRTFVVTWQDFEVHGALDEVAGLGPFVELELSAQGDDAVEAPRRAIAAVADELGLGPSERRSYLELLLEAHK